MTLFDRAAESLKADIHRQRGHRGGQQFPRNDDRSFHRVHRHDCGWEGEAVVYQCAAFETFRCEGCGSDVTLWDEEDVLRDGGDGIAPHVDDDRLDGDPEAFPWHGRETA